MSPGELIVHATGALVRVTYRQRTVDATVLLASGNGKSLMLSFEALLGGYAGMMPVLWDDDAREFRGLVCGERVGVEAQ